MRKEGVQRYEPNWDSLSKYEVPDWYKDAKFGIFIHWGVYSVPAFSFEWYPYRMYRKGSKEYEHHIKTWGKHKEFGYKDFIPMFKAEKWDPEAWVDLFKRSGARYVVPVGEHHDGFPMYDTKYTEWNAARMGPCRDVVAELAEVTRAAGLKFGVSSHRALHYWYFTFDDEFDTVDPRYAGLYGPIHSNDEIFSPSTPVDQEFLEDWWGRTTELIDKFQPDYLFFDCGWNFYKEYLPYRPKITAYYYNRALEWGKEVVLTSKGDFPLGTVVFDIERGKSDRLRTDYWQTDTSVSYRSWSYIEDDDFRTTTSLVHELVDIVSKNGNLLLNVGPRADGTIPDEVADLLLGMGEWLNINGEAIYGTRPWWIYGYGRTKTGQRMREKEYEDYTADDVRFTQKGDTLYAILLGWPTNEVVIQQLARNSGFWANDIQEVQLLGSNDRIRWTQDEKALRVTMPPTKPCDHAYVLKIK
jgi:alpha-L-fucosidase